MKLFEHFNILYDDGNERCQKARANFYEALDKYHTPMADLAITNNSLYRLIYEDAKASRHFGQANSYMEGFNSCDIAVRHKFQTGKYAGLIISESNDEIGLFYSRHISIPDSIAMLEKALKQLKAGDMFDTEDENGPITIEKI